MRTARAHTLAPARVVAVGRHLPPETLGACGAAQVEHVAAAALDAPWDERDVLVLAWDDPERDRQTIQALGQRPPAARPRIVVAGDVESAALHPLLDRDAIIQVVSTRGPAADRDLAITLAKLLSHDLFGMERYFPSAPPPARFVCATSARRDEVFEWLRTFATANHVKARVVDLMLVVADELFTNAFYNAPVDARGHHLYADRSRTSPVALDAPTAITLELRCDGARFGIAASDPFGSLAPEVVLASLRRSFRRATPRVGTSGGAGLGLYLLLTSLTSVIFNVAPGRRTEVIGLIDVAGSYRQAVAAGKSLTLFVEE